MRTVYIDVLITVNIFIDFFIILCTKKFLHLGTSYSRMIIGSLLGGIFSLTALFPELPFGINIIFDIFSAAVIVFSVFGMCNLKNYIKRVAVYFFISFSFCGIMIFIYTSFRPNGMEIYNDTVYFNVSPVVLIILTLACYYILKLIKRLTKGVCGGGICNVEFYLANKSFMFSAKIDSGCNVKEPFSGDYVIIAEEDLMDGCIPDIKSTRVIPFNSLGGDGIIIGFKPDKIIINGVEIKDVYIGICKNVIKGDIRALIPYEILKNIE